MYRLIPIENALRSNWSNFGLKFWVLVDIRNVSSLLGSKGFRFGRKTDEMTKTDYPGEIIDF